VPGHCDGTGCLLRYLTGAITAGRLVCYWNLPLFSYSSIDPKLSDKNVYNTLIRMMSPFNHMATCLGKLFQHYQVGIVQITATPSQVIALITCAGILYFVPIFLQKVRASRPRHCENKANRSL